MARPHLPMPRRAVLNHRVTVLGPCVSARSARPALRAAAASPIHCPTRAARRFGVNLLLEPTPEVMATSDHYRAHFDYRDQLVKSFCLNHARFGRNGCSKDLDDLLMGHDNYLTSIVEKSLTGERVNQKQNQGNKFMAGGAEKSHDSTHEELFRKMGEDLDSIAKDYLTSLDSFISSCPATR
ncbi:hypothetical protein ZWY2020_028714 [Hordeum vulgare]|nr:hypothetical protein ZWY2020_028714 [Hordeum vulgare]